MKFITLNAVGKEHSFYLSKEDIVVIFPRFSGEGTEVFIRGMNDPFIVKETASEILERL